MKNNTIIINIIMTTITVILTTHSHVPNSLSVQQYRLLRVMRVDHGTFVFSGIGCHKVVHSVDATGDGVAPEDAL